MTALLMMTTRAAMSDNKNDKEWSDFEVKRAQLLEKGSVEAALVIYDKMAEHAEKQGRIEDAASVRRDKVGLLHNLQQDSLLIEEATRQMAWMEQHGQKEYFYRIWRLMAESYYFSHKPQTALRQAKLMLEYAQEHGDDQGRASAYQQMGFNYLEVDNDEAIKTYQHSIKLFRQMSGDHYGDLNRSYGYLCEALENKKDYANELKYCAEWKKLLDEWGRNAVGKQMNRVYIEQHLQTASALIGLGRIDEAEQELAESERLNQIEKDDYYNYVILVHKAQATRLFRTLAEQGMMPAEICTHINNALSGEDNEQGMFVTMFLGLVDLKTGHLDFCNAGHNPPVLGGDEHQGSFLEMEPNAPIGLWPGLEFVGESIESIKGRPLFIYTDGLNEAENTRHEQFGDDRLLSSLRDTSYESSRQVIETLAALVEAHRQGAEPNDDLTMMCLRLS